MGEQLLDGTRTVRILMDMRFDLVFTLQKKIDAMDRVAQPATALLEVFWDAGSRTSARI